MQKYIIPICLSVLALMLGSELCLSQPVERDISKIYERSDNRFWGKIFSDIFRKKTFNKSYAIVIGLSDYSGKWSALDSPYHDALKVRDYLINKAGFDYVLTLTNKKATKKLIEEYMEQTFPAMIGDNDRFLFYYSGHGTQRQLGNRVRGYLPMLNSGEETWADMISMDDIERWNENIHEAKQVLFVLDCCFSGAAGIQTKGKGQKLYLEDLSKYGHHLVTAGTASQQSYGSIRRWGGSLFTTAFVSGISGGADAGTDEFPKDGVVSLTELEEYIKKRIKKEAARNRAINQSPRLYDLDVDMVESVGEFFFITEEERLRSLETENQKTIEYGWPVEVKGALKPAIIRALDLPAHTQVFVGNEAVELPHELPPGTYNIRLKRDGFRTIKIPRTLEPEQVLWLPSPEWVPTVPWGLRTRAFATSLVPGLGQHLQGRRTRGLIYEAATVSAGAVALWAWFDHKGKIDDYEKDPYDLDLHSKASSARRLAIITQVVCGVVWVTNALDAAIIVKPEPRDNDAALGLYPTSDGVQIMVRAPF